MKGLFCSRILRSGNCKTSRLLSVILVSATLLCSSVTRVMHVTSVSMATTLCDGDGIIAESLRWNVHRRFSRLFPPRRGEIIIFLQPQDDVLTIKRIVGLGGERIHISGGLTYVNGIRVQEPYVRHAVGHERDGDSWPQGVTGSGVRDILIPKANLFVMGDNRDESVDSRTWGPVPETNVVGTFLLRIPRFTLGNAPRCGY